MKTITAKQLSDMQDRNEDFLLVNTLDEEHFSDTEIPGAINIPQSADDFVQRVEQSAESKNQKIVTYCANRQCPSSTEGAKKLEAAGFTNVFEFEEGAEGWKQSGKQLAHA